MTHNAELRATRTVNDITDLVTKTKRIFNASW